MKINFFTPVPKIYLTKKLKISENINNKYRNGWNREHTLCSVYRIELQVTGKEEKTNLLLSFKPGILFFQALEFFLQLKYISLHEINTKTKMLDRERVKHKLYTQHGT